MLQLPRPDLEVLLPVRNPMLGAVLVRKGVSPRDWEAYQGLLADRVAWLIKENQGDASPLLESLEQAGLMEASQEPEEALSTLRSPESRAYLRNLGLDLPLSRPTDQARVLARVQETPLEEWAAMLAPSEN